MLMWSELAQSSLQAPLARPKRRREFLGTRLQAARAIDVNEEDTLFEAGEFGVFAFFCLFIKSS